MSTDEHYTSTYDAEDIIAMIKESLRELNDEQLCAVALAAGIGRFRSTSELGRL